MSDTYELTIHGLLRKRADMAGEAEAIRARLSVALSDLDHIDAVIRLFKPDIEHGDLPTRAVLTPSRASRGEVQRHIFEVLRAAIAPMTTRELTRFIMERRSMNADDRVLFKPDPTESRAYACRAEASRKSAIGSRVVGRAAAVADDVRRAVREYG